MVNDNNNEWNIYKIDTKAKLDKRKIFIIILIVLSLICIILTGGYIARMIKEYKTYKQYEAQLQTIKYEEEEKQKRQAEEAERKRQERIPKLTDERKTKH